MLRSSGAGWFVGTLFYKHRAATRLKTKPSPTFGLLSTRYRERFRNYFLSRMRNLSLLVFACTVG